MLVYREKVAAVRQDGLDALERLSNDVELIILLRSVYLPHKVKSSMCISDYIHTAFFYLERFLMKLADDNALQ